MENGEKTGTRYTGQARSRRQALVLSVAITALMIGLAVSFEYLARSLPGLALPYGGTFSLTCLPLLLGALTTGPLWGVMGGVVYGLLNYFIDGYEFVLGSFFLDYLLAFGSMGLAGAFAKPFLRRRWWAFPAGAVAAMALRYVCHGFSGVLFFASYAPAGMNPWFYSFVAYNAPYMAASLGLDLAIGAFVVVPLGSVFGHAAFRPLLIKAGIADNSIRIATASGGKKPAAVYRTEEKHMSCSDCGPKAVVESAASIKAAVLALAAPESDEATIRQAVATVTAAAGQNQLRALVLLGILEETGTFVPADLDGAVALFEKAAGLGSVTALFRLGAIYLGENAKRDPGKGLDLVRKAAVKGLPEALAVLGEAYEKGIAVAVDRQKAASFYVDAGQRGLGYGYYRLAQLLGQDGQLAEADRSLAQAERLGYDPLSGEQDFLGLRR